MIDCTYWISIRERKGQRWEGLGNSEDLAYAFEVAGKSNSPETAIWVATESRTVLYWTSSSPEIFNSVAIENRIAGY